MKRILGIIAGVIVVFGMAGTVYAQAVSSSYDAPVGVSTTPAAKPTSGYDGGFFMGSPDDQFKLVINGRLHARWYLDKQTDHEAIQTFAIRRARVDFTSYIMEKMEVNIALNYGTSTPQFTSINLYNATAAYTFVPEFVLAVGTIGLPLSTVGSVGSANAFLMPEPPLPITQRDGEKDPATILRESFGSPDGLGLQAEGTISKFFYRLALVNGASDEEGTESNYDLNPDKKVSAGFRLGVNVLDPVPGAEMDLAYSEKPKLTFAVGGIYQSRRKMPDQTINGVLWTGPTIGKIFTGCVSGHFRWRGLALNAEAFGRRMYVDDAGSAIFYSPKLDDIGYYVDGGYFVIPKKFEIAATGSQIIREGPDNNSYQVGGGLNWYIKNNNLKLQLAYTLTVDFDDITGTRNNKEHMATVNLVTSF